VSIDGTPGNEFDMDAPTGGDMYATGFLGGTTYPNEDFGMKAPGEKPGAFFWMRTHTKGRGYGMIGTLWRSAYGIKHEGDARNRVGGATGNRIADERAVEGNGKEVSGTG
jgi:hypothetical protein